VRDASKTYSDFERSRRLVRERETEKPKAGNSSNGNQINQIKQLICDSMLLMPLSKGMLSPIVIIFRSRKLTSIERPDVIYGRVEMYSLFGSTQVS